MIPYPFPEMASADAFVTHGLLLQRWQQRRTLRRIPNDVVRHGANKLQSQPYEFRANAAFERGRTEWALRDAIDRRLEDEEVVAWLDKLAEVEEAQFAYFVIDQTYHSSHWMRSEDPLRDTVEELREKMRMPNYSDAVDRLAVLAYLLVTADELSDDGYKDPRLADPSRH